MDRILFTDSWSFFRNDEAEKMVSIPHDAMQEAGRCADSPSGQAGGFYNGGFYIYEKDLIVTKELTKKVLILEFGGVYPTAKVFINGNLAGGCEYGYSEFRVRIDEFLIEGSNTIRVEADHTKLPDSRWYSGAGIYRPVYLLIGEKTHIVPCSLKLETRSIGEFANVLAGVHIEGIQDNDVELNYEIYDDNNMIIAGTFDNNMNFRGDETAGIRYYETEIKIDKPRLWFAETPNLYNCRVFLKGADGSCLDTDGQRFGIRLISYDEKGLYINGVETLLKGGCLHHDNGVIGARSYKSAEIRKIEKLKKYGFNAIRSAHNPASRELLDACDELGMYVMDEAWDMWYKHKNPEDYAGKFREFYEYDIRSMVDKDYNHPSVIMYSIGNEVTEPSDNEGVEMTGSLVSLFHKYDKTRPVTAGINLTLLYMAKLGINANEPHKDQNGEENKKRVSSTDFNKMMSEGNARMVSAAAMPEVDKLTSPCLDKLDIAGYNYASSRYENEDKLNPGRLIVGTETYAQDIAHNWEMVEKYPYIIGDFMWTAWDYIGEAGIGSFVYDKDSNKFEKNYPWLLADTGVFDILGNPTAEAGLAGAVFRAFKKPQIYIQPVNHPDDELYKAMWRGSNGLPVWSYRGCDGNKAHVEVYSDSYEIELFINEKSIGKRPVSEYVAEFDTEYENGVLKAISYDENGIVVADRELISATGNLTIKCYPEKEVVNKGELAFIDISIVGENGVVEANSDKEVGIEVEGGELLGYGSANPRTEESFIEGKYKTYYGKSLAVILARDTGTMKISAKANGLGCDTCTIKVK